MKTPVHALVLAAILASTAGCAELLGAAMPALPSAAPSGAPVTGASAAPGTTTTPAATPAPTATATPAPAATAKPAATWAGGKDPEAVAADCSGTKDDSEKDNGTAKLGGYDNQWLPKGWLAAYNSEAEVTAAIDKINPADWACFQKYYPGASTIWKRRKGYEK